MIKKITLLLLSIIVIVGLYFYIQVQKVRTLIDFCTSIDRGTPIAALELSVKELGYSLVSESPWNGEHDSNNYYIIDTSSFLEKRWCTVKHREEIVENTNLK